MITQDVQQLVLLFQSSSAPGLIRSFLLSAQMSFLKVPLVSALIQKNIRGSELAVLNWPQVWTCVCPWCLTPFLSGTGPRSTITINWLSTWVRVRFCQYFVYINEEWSKNKHVIWMYTYISVQIYNQVEAVQCIKSCRASVNFCPVNIEHPIGENVALVTGCWC